MNIRVRKWLWDATEETGLPAWPAGNGMVEIAWVVADESEAEVGWRMSRLPEAERVRGLRFQAARARAEFVAGRTMLRSWLAAGLRCLPPEVPLRIDGQGRPGLDDESWRVVEAGAKDLDFNLAHAAGVVAVALARAWRVGIDLEPANAGVNSADLAEQVFSAGEMAGYLGLPEEARGDRFVRAWVAKEAILKALGTGLLVDPRRVELAWAEAAEPRLRRIDGVLGEVEARGWSLGSWNGPPGLRGAWACAPDGGARRVR